MQSDSQFFLILRTTTVRLSGRNSAPRHGCYYHDAKATAQPPCLCLRKSKSFKSLPDTTCISARDNAPDESVSRVSNLDQSFQRLISS